jgi:hypothetical protein
MSAPDEKTAPAAPPDAPPRADDPLDLFLSPPPRLREKLREARAARDALLAAAKEHRRAFDAWYAAARDFPSALLEHRDAVQADVRLSAAHLRWSDAALSLADLLVAPLESHR